MGDLIDRQAALDALRNAENHAFNAYYKGLVRAHKIIAELPSAQPELESADAVQVVRCRDCRKCSYDSLFDHWWCNMTLGTRRVKPDDFCSYGEREE